MKIEKSNDGNKNPRTGIIPGDVIHISLETSHPIVSVFRHFEHRLLFESNGNNKKVFDFYPSAYGSCITIMQIICEITGLEATETEKNENFVRFVMKEGDRIFTGKPTHEESEKQTIKELLKKQKS